MNRDPGAGVTVVYLIDTPVLFIDTLYESHQENFIKSQLFAVPGGLVQGIPVTGLVGETL